MKIENITLVNFYGLVRPLKFEVIGVFIKLIENNAKFTIAVNPHKLKETYD